MIFFGHTISIIWTTTATCKLCCCSFKRRSIFLSYSPFSVVLLTDDHEQWYFIVLFNNTVKYESSLLSFIHPFTYWSREKLNLKAGYLMVGGWFDFSHHMKRERVEEIFNKHTSEACIQWWPSITFQTYHTKQPDL